MATNDKKTFYEKFKEYLEFLKSNQNPDVTVLSDKYKAYLYDEKQSFTKFFQEKINLYTYESLDTRLLYEFIKDWYSSLKVINKETNYSKNPYFASSEYLDNVIKSLGIPFPDLLISYVKPQFAQDIVNIYKIKGTAPSIQTTLKYFYLIPVELYEVWLELDNKLYGNPGELDLYFKAYPIRGNELRNTQFDVTFKQAYDYVASKDPHWYYTRDDIWNIITNSDINDGLELPSLTPYIKIVASPPKENYTTQLIHLIKMVHEEYNYYQCHKNDEDFDFNKYRLLYHEDSDKFVSMLEIFCAIGYLWDKRYGKYMDDEADGNILLSNITLPDDEYPPEATELDHISRYYEYLKLKEKYEEITSFPLSGHPYDTQMGYLREDGDDLIKEHGYFKVKTLLNINYEIRNDFYLLIDNRTDFAISEYGNNIIISGGIVNGNISDELIYIDKFSMRTKVVKTSPIRLRNHGVFYCNGSIYLVGGFDDSGNYNTKLYRYIIERDLWREYEIGFKYSHFYTCNINDRHVLLCFGRNESNIYDRKCYIFDNEYNKVINLNNFESFSFDEYDIGFNNNNDIVFYFNDQNYLYKLNLNELMIYISENKLDNTDDNGWLNDVNPISFEANYNYPNMETIDISSITFDNNYLVSTFILNNGDIYLNNNEEIYRYKNNIWEYHQISKGQPFPQIKNGIKINLTNDDIVYINNKVSITGNDTQYFITFEFQEYSTPLTNTSTWSYDSSIDTTFEKPDYPIIGTPYERTEHPTIRQQIKDKWNQYLQTFTRKAPNEKYVRFEFDNQTCLEDVIDSDISDDNLVLDNVNKLEAFLEEINPEFKYYLDEILSRPNEADFNIGFFNVVALLDTFTNLYLNENSYFSQYYLKMDENICRIVDMFKPIHTRYQKSLTLSLEIKDPFNIFIPAEYFVPKIKTYNYDYHDFAESFRYDIYIDLIDIPYTPEYHQQYDIDDWRNVRYDLLIREVINMLLTMDIRETFNTNEAIALVNQMTFVDRCYPVFDDPPNPLQNFDEHCPNDNNTYTKVVQYIKDVFQTYAITDETIINNSLVWDGINPITGLNFRFDNISNATPNNVLSTNDAISVEIIQY